MKAAGFTATQLNFCDNEKFAVHQGKTEKVVINIKGNNTYIHLLFPKHNKKIKFRKSPSLKVIFINCKVVSNYCKTRTLTINDFTYVNVSSR